MQTKLIATDRDAWHLVAGALSYALCCLMLMTPNASAAEDPLVIGIVAIQGTNLWVSPVGAADWLQVSPALRALKVGDRVRTGPDTRVTLQLPNRGVFRIRENTEFVFRQPPAQKRSIWLSIRRGFAYFFHRGEPDDIEIQSRTASAGVKGTEFQVQVLDDESMRVTVFDGVVELTNTVGSVQLTRLEQGNAVPGQAPTKTPVIDAISLIQWCLYYPAIMDPEDLRFPAGDRAALDLSLRSYAEGDLLRAFQRYPADREPASPDEKLFYAGLVLALGEVDRARQLLQSIDAGAIHSADQDRVRRLASALDVLIGAVQGRTAESLPPPVLSSEWLSRSFQLQSQGRLSDALDAARQAVRISPLFAFGWTRVAELEFGFGRPSRTETTIDLSLALAPRNAQAWALRGFLLAARNRHRAAIAAFDRAIDIDAGLGNAWLGRGLVRMRTGNLPGGLDDLETAAALEPNRALLRSYLGKAYSVEGRTHLALNEMSRAKSLDPADPTPWLYTPLVLRRENRINEAVSDLEHSRKLNDNRSLYRSELMLDQDQAVRSANLAALYEDAGLRDVAVREAGRAVASDYANYSAHLFLANAYNQLRDRKQVNLRYETAWFSEYLLANLLSPAGAGILSQTVSQQEYSRLFDRNRLGLVSQTEYTSNGDWTQAASQYGSIDGTEYAIDSFYSFDNGQRPNNQFEQFTGAVQLKQQLTPDDTLFFQAIYYFTEGGDLAQVYDPDNPDSIRSQLRFQESQEPLLLGGLRHHWSPAHDTLLLVGRLEDTLSLQDPSHPTAQVETAGRTQLAVPLHPDLDYRSEIDIYSGEAQHILHGNNHTVVAGFRLQEGRFLATSRHDNLPDEPSSATTSTDSRMHRFTGYFYEHWRPISSLLLVAGLSYDRISYPLNHRIAPLSHEEKTSHLLAPKAGAVWSPNPHTTLRAAYSESLSGVSLDQSVRLEPTQVTGINQAFRSVIPESLVGSLPAEKFRMLAAEWEEHLPTRTYLALRGQWLRSDADRLVGAFRTYYDIPTFQYRTEPVNLRQEFDYDERTVTFSAHQLLTKEWSLGIDYRLSRAHLHQAMPGVAIHVPGAGLYNQKPARSESTSTLHQLLLSANYNHSCGFFSRAEGLWYLQDSMDTAGDDLPTTDFWQCNAFVGYRLFQRRGEVQLGLLNINDQDYRLNPLNLTATLPRDRTFVMRVRFNF